MASGRPTSPYYLWNAVTEHYETIIDRVHFMRKRRHVYGIVLPLPMHAVSPTRPSRLLVSPPVDVAQATFPALSIATAPTVPRSLPKIAFQTISCRSQSI